MPTTARVASCDTCIASRLALASLCSSLSLKPEAPLTGTHPSSLPAVKLWSAAAQFPLNPDYLVPERAMVRAPSDAPRSWLAGLANVNGRHDDPVGLVARPAVTSTAPAAAT